MRARLSHFAKERSKTYDMASHFLNSDGTPKNRPKYRWQEILEQHPKEEIIKAFDTRGMQAMAKEWGCHVDVCYTLRDKLGLSKKWTQEDIIKQYSKEKLMDLYFNQFRTIKEVADHIGCYQDTLSKVFKKLDINFKEFVPTEEMKENLRQKALTPERIAVATENLKKITPEKKHLGDETRKSRGSAKRAHKANRALEAFSLDEIDKMVEYRGVLGTARFLGISQWAIRSFCYKHKITLSNGAKKAMTETPQYKAQARLKGVHTVQRSKKKNTSIEIAVQNELKSRGIKFETHKNLENITVPDVFIEPNIVIYLDGCFWHACPEHCSGSIIGNKRAIKDKVINEALRKKGYVVLRFWEHDIKKDVGKCVDTVLSYIGLNNKKGDKK
jgi:DNA mismatch endonuclease (patch repair protein)